jgi:hypothetical protein
MKLLDAPELVIQDLLVVAVRAKYFFFFSFSRALVVTRVRLELHLFLGQWSCLCSILHLPHLVAAEGSLTAAGVVRVGSSFLEFPPLEWGHPCPLQLP